MKKSINGKQKFKQERHLDRQLLQQIHNLKLTNKVFHKKYEYKMNDQPKYGHMCVFKHTFLFSLTPS